MKKLYLMQYLPNSVVDNFLKDRLEEKIRLFDENTIPFKELSIIIDKNKLRRQYIGDSLNTQNLYSRDGVVNDIFFNEINKNLLMYKYIYVKDLFLTISQRMEIYRKIRGLGQDVELYMLRWPLDVKQALNNPTDVDYNEFDLTHMLNSYKPIENNELILYKQIYDL